MPQIPTQEDIKKFEETKQGTIDILSNVHLEDGGYILICSEKNSEGVECITTRAALIDNKLTSFEFSLAIAKAMGNDQNLCSIILFAAERFLKTHGIE